MRRSLRRRTGLPVRTSVAAPPPLTLGSGMGLVVCDAGGAVLAVGSYAGGWAVDVDAFVTASTLHVDVHRAGVAEWFVAFWPTGKVCAYSRLVRPAPVELGDAVSFPPGGLRIGCTPVPPPDAPSGVLRALPPGR